jgi:hypothetical protein
MLHLFLNPSPLLGAGEALIGMSLLMFVAALVAAFGDARRAIGADWGRGDPTLIRRSNIKSLLDRDDLPREIV